MKTNHRGLRRLAAILTIAAAGAVVSPSPAQAAPPGFPSRMRSTGAFRFCVNKDLTGCAERGELKEGTYVRMTCWQKGTRGTVHGVSSDMYFWVTTSNGVRGFVFAERVENQTPGVDACTKHAGVDPARWAAEHIGKDKVTATEARGTGAKYWSSNCLLFTQDAYLMTGGQAKTGLGSAKLATDRYRSKGLLETNMDPAAIKIGSYVFYGTATHGALSHVGIYVGKGQVVSTQGSKESQHLEVAIHGLGSAIGWVAPDNVNK